MKENEKEFMSKVMERVFQLLNNTGKGDYPLAIEIGLGRSSIQSWRNNKSNAGAYALVKIADYFNVSLDYLVGRETPTTNKETNTVNKAVNSTLLSRIESLDELQQTKVMAYIDGLQDTNNNDLIATAVNRGIANKQKDKSKIS